MVRGLPLPRLPLPRLQDARPRVLRRRVPSTISTLFSMPFDFNLSDFSDRWVRRRSRSNSCRRRSSGCSTWFLSLWDGGCDRSPPSLSLITSSPPSHRQIRVRSKISRIEPPRLCSKSKPVAIDLTPRSRNIGVSIVS